MTNKATKDIHREQNMKIGLSVLAIFVTIMGGGVCYAHLEAWPYMDAVYFASMTTLVRVSKSHFPC